MENAQGESNPTKPITDDNINIELNKEFLIELKNNAYHGMFDEDVVDHIAKMNGNGNKRRMNDNILNNNEWKKSDYGNPLNTATNSFFKAHDECHVEEGNELRQIKHKGDNKNDEQPNKRIVSLVGPAGDPWDQRVRSQLIGKDLVSGLLVYELPLSSLRKKYRLSLKNDMPPRDK
ncbi:hypothetical protein Tco_1178660 [Tanacetum coccineum]